MRTFLIAHRSTALRAFHLVWFLVGLAGCAALGWVVCWLWGDPFPRSWGMAAGAVGFILLEGRNLWREMRDPG